MVDRNPACFTVEFKYKYKSFKHEDSIKSLKEINADLKMIQRWADDSNLQLNVSKIHTGNRYQL